MPLSEWETGGNIGQVWTRVLHYRYNCNDDFQQCADEEQFYLANGFGEWQWKHYHHGAPVNSTLINNLEQGSTDATLPRADSYEPRTPSSQAEGQPLKSVDKPADFGLSSVPERSAPAARIRLAWPQPASPRSPAPSSTSIWTPSSSPWKSSTILR
jgi:hypothetical protein